jgi:hypothetical protein
MNRSLRRCEERLQRTAAGKPWVLLRAAVPVPFTEHQIEEHSPTAASTATATRTSAPFVDTQSDEVWKNDQYQVAVRHLKGGPEAVPMVQLSILRIDRQPIHNRRDLQRIKNQPVGAECEVVELYPAESRLVDAANQYFLYAVLDPTFRFPWALAAPRHRASGELDHRVDRRNLRNKPTARLRPASSCCRTSAGPKAEPSMQRREPASVCSSRCRLISAIARTQGLAPC